MPPEPDRNFVESIKDEVVLAGLDPLDSEDTVPDLVADRGAQLVDEESFEGVLALPRREVDQKGYSFLAFSLI